MLETQRLIHRPFDVDDLDTLVELRSDPEVAIYLGGEKAMTRDWNQGRLEFYISCYKDGIGMHKMYWKENDELIGWSGLQPLQGEGEIEVGFGLIKEFWRRGIGYETARGWLDFGFDQRALERIVAVSHVENTGSRRILEKLGMKHEKTSEFYNMECAYYAIKNTEFRSREAGME